MDLLPSAQEMVLPSDYSPAYRLATLLIHKLLNKDEWDKDWEVTETSLRETCLEKGVHPVWIDLAQRTALLGQFAAFPKAKVSKAKVGKKVKLSSAFINPFVSEELITAVNEISPAVTDAESQVALRNTISQLSSGRPLQPAKVLLELEGSASALSALLAIASNQDPTESFERLKEVDADLSEQLNDFYSLKNGKVIDWKKSKKAKGGHSLAHARQLLAWEQAPDEASKLSSKTMLASLESAMRSSSCPCLCSN